MPSVSLLSRLFCRRSAIRRIPAVAASLAIACLLLVTQDATAAIHAFVTLSGTPSIGASEQGENYAHQEAAGMTEDWLGRQNSARASGTSNGTPGANTWDLHSYADASSNWGAESSARTQSNWFDSVTATAPNPGQVTLRFHFLLTGVLQSAVGGAGAGALASNSLVVFTYDINGFSANVSYEVNLHGWTDLSGTPFIQYRNSYSGPSQDEFGPYYFDSGFEFQNALIFFVGADYFDVGINLTQHNADGTWSGSTPYSIYFVSRAAATRGVALADFGHTALLTSVLIAGTDVTAESAGYSLSFDSGLISPNIEDAAVPEPASLLGWSGLCLLGLVAKFRLVQK